MKKIILIKLGGSLITEKDKPMTACQDIIDQIAGEIAGLYRQTTDYQFILGNGAGSFGHYLVQKYNIQGGIKTPDQIEGFCQVQDAVAQLNRLVVKALLHEHVPVCTVQPSAILIAEDAQKKELFLQPIQQMMEKGIIPVLYGDIILDTKQGSHIFSTEDMFDLLIQADMPITTVVHLTQVAGVLDQNQKVIPVITEQNWPAVQKHIYAPKGFDITGGMKHKIEKALVYARKSVKTIIISGEEGILTKTVHGECFGTTIVPFIDTQPGEDH